MWVEGHGLQSAALPLHQRNAHDDGEVAGDRRVTRRLDATTRQRAAATNQENLNARALLAWKRRRTG